MQTIGLEIVVICTSEVDSQIGLETMATLVLSTGPPPALHPGTFHVKQSRFLHALSPTLVDVSPRLTLGQLRQLEDHWRLVLAWTARTNLTAITDDADAALLHYRDSLEALAVLPPGPIVDLGSGAGYPGLPIAIAEPARSVTLVEPRAKRVSFLKVAVARLGLANVRVRQASSTDTPDQAYAAAVTRATFSDSADLLACQRWLAFGGLLVAFRSAASGDRDAELHSYAIAGQPRLLELWRRVLRGAR